MSKNLSFKLALSHEHNKTHHMLLMVAGTTIGSVDSRPCPPRYVSATLFLRNSIL